MKSKRRRNEKYEKLATRNKPFGANSVTYRVAISKNLLLKIENSTRTKLEKSYIKLV